MASKRRLLRLALTALVIVGIAGFGVFSTFLYNPFEGKYEFDVASLVPREVDFYVSKADLRGDFDPFPRPAFADELEQSARAKAFLEHPRVAGWLEGLGIDEALTQLDAALAQLPVQVDPLQVFGGEDLAIAGTLNGDDLTQADWAVYGRTSTLGRIGVELLSYPGLLGLSEQGFVVEDVGEAVSLEGGQLPRKLFVERIQDVIIVATKADYVESALALEGSRGQDSFGQSAKYGDSIASLEREGDELELYADYRVLRQGLRLPENLVDPYSANVAEAVLGNLLPTASIRELAGIVGFGQGVQLRLHGNLSSENLTAVQKRFLRVRGAAKDDVRFAAMFAPEDTGAFVYLTGDIGDILREALRAVDNEALKSNLADVVRNVWGHSDVNMLIDDLETAFKDRAALVVRDNDYPDEGASGPPHDDRTVPAWALILFPQEREKIDELINRVIARQSYLGIRGHEPGSRGVFDNEVAGGTNVKEYWSEFVPGTGHIASSEIRLGSSDSSRAARERAVSSRNRGAEEERTRESVGREDVFLVSNNHQMIGAMVKTFFEGGPTWPRLADKPFFETLVNVGLPSSNLTVWVDPRAISDTTRELARETAMLVAADDIDWAIERPRIEKEILRAQFPGETWGALSPEVEQQLAILAEQAAEEFRAEHVAGRAPELRQAAEATLDALEATSGTFVELGLDQRAFDLLVRVIVPFD